MNKEKIINQNNKYIDEAEEWLRMTPAQRIIESGKLWKLYLSIGGNLDREPDTQSPFYVPEVRNKKPLNWRTGLYYLRRG